MNLSILNSITCTRNLRFAWRCHPVQWNLYLFDHGNGILRVTMHLSTDIWLDDEGLYVCEAKNQFGTIRTEARVSVSGLGMNSCLCSVLPFSADR